MARMKIASEEEVTEILFNVLGFIGIVTACLGLLGLSAYTAEAKRKEYSIRRTFGATSASLFYTSTMNHLILVVIATLIATPLGYYLSDQWLHSFAYHENLNLLPFIFAGLLATVLAFVTVGSQVIKVVSNRPSAMLRSE